jgi:hypothetical protein
MTGIMPSEETRSKYILTKQIVRSAAEDLDDQSSSWKKVGPVACGGAVEGPASAMSMSFWAYAAS